MIRFGMNKKSKDPVNIELPFYYIKNGVYTPTKDLYICEPSRSFYRVNDFGRRIVWMETEGDVQTIVPPSLSSVISTIHIDKDIIISEGENPCSITDNNGDIFYGNEFHIDGSCLLIHDPLSYKTIYIKAYGKVTILD
jgi:hypothetical protein